MTMRSKKSGRELAEELLPLLRAGDGLIEAEVDLVGGVDAPVLLVDGGRQFDLGAVLALDGLRAGAELGHGRAEGAEVVDHGLVDEDVAVGEEEDALLAPGLPQPPDDLEGGVGLAGAGGHDEQDAVLALGDGFDGRVDGDALVVARLLAAAVVEVVLEDDLLPASGARPFQARYCAQSCSGRREGVERQLGFRLAALAGAVVEQEAVAVGGEDEGDVEGRGVLERLLHAVADGVVVVLGLDEGDGDVRLVVEDVVGALGLAAGDQLAADDDAALGEADLLANLRHGHPSPPA